MPRTALAGTSRGERALRTPLQRDSISELTASRLAVYLRQLNELEARGVRHISSKDFARGLDSSSAQIRKDLATFGEFGVRGVGYEVVGLKKHLLSILGLDRTRPVAIIGAGHLGEALANYAGFSTGGFRICALFDNDPQKIGTKSRGGLTVLDVQKLSEVVRREGIQIGIITVPSEAAQEVVERCCETGVKAILNFAPARLTVPAGVRLKNVDLKINLETLSFYLSRP